MIDMAGQEVESPEYVDDFLDGKRVVHVHAFRMHPELVGRNPDPSYIANILRDGIVSPLLAKKLGEMGVKTFSMPPNAGTTRHGTDEIEPEVHAIQYQGRRGLDLNQFKGKLPAIVFSKPGFKKSSKARVQPRFILGVVLPPLSEGEVAKWVEELRHFNKPLYRHDGIKAWGPETQ